MFLLQCLCKSASNCCQMTPELRECIYNTHTKNLPACSDPLYNNSKTTDKQHAYSWLQPYAYRLYLVHSSRVKCCINCPKGEREGAVITMNSPNHSCRSVLMAETHYLYTNPAVNACVLYLANMLEPLDNSAYLKCKN